MNSTENQTLMNRQETVRTPQTTAKKPEIKFVIVNDERDKLDRLLSSKPKPVMTNDKEHVKEHVKIEVLPSIVDRQDIIDRIDICLDKAKPTLKYLSEGSVSVIRVTVYLSGFVIAKSIKYSFIFAGAAIGGLLTGLIDAFRQDSIQQFEFEDREESSSKNSNFNNSTFNNSTVNIQINNR